MSWMEMSMMSQRKEFVALAMAEEANISELCRRYRISRKTGYKWIARAASGEGDWARDRWRRPHRSQGQISAELEEAILEVRDKHPVWGARKIRNCLERAGCKKIPAVSTVHEVLRRRGELKKRPVSQPSQMKRFERESPNELWQMDFKEGFQTARGPCHPLTILDDHSRFSVSVRACSNQRESTVRSSLISTFQRYGLPEQMLMDNGSCWGRATSRYTKLGAWLIRLGIAIRHGRFYHPQTQGKNERFNQTLGLEAIQGRNFHDLKACQRAFDEFRHCYNHHRPHEALGMQSPVSRYQVSAFTYPQKLTPIQYPSTDEVRKVIPAGAVSYKNHFYQVGRAFSGQPVALRSTESDGVLAVYYCHHQIAEINLHKRSCRQC